MKNYTNAIHIYLLFVKRRNSTMPADCKQSEAWRGKTQRNYCSLKTQTGHFYRTTYTQTMAKTHKFTNTMDKATLCFHKYLR